MTVKKEGAASACAFSFGPFTLVPQRQLLLRGDVPVRIGGRALDILAALVEHPDELISKAALLARAWPDTIVHEGSLKVTVAALRRALGAGGGDHGAYIATTPGQGYQFTAPVLRTTAATFEQVTATPAACRHNLPPGTARIVGRAATITAILQELDGARLMSIVGPGGVGKTTVAVAVAAQALGTRADGVWLVDLAPLKDPALLPSAIAAAIGMAPYAAHMQDALCNYLRGRAMLLVLDSCEHLVDAVAACAARILAAAPDVTILVTSRAPLRVDSERVHRLPGLGLPPAAPGLTAHQAMAFPAVELFVDRATDRLDSFSLVDAEAPLVADICRQLDGLALAIELAATRIDAFGVAGLRDQLAHCFRLPEGRRGGPERHRTLTATIAWSYDLLSGSEQALLRRLAVFAGAFSLASACAIGAEDGGDDANVVHDLARLVDQSLVAATARGGAADYRLLDTTRAYCRDLLHRSGEEQSMLRRHAAHVCSVLERAAGEWAVRAAPDWGAAYGPLIDDLRAALAWTGRDCAWRPLRIRLTVAGTLLWNHFSHTDECRIQVALALGELGAAGLTGGVTEMQLQWSLAGAAMFTRGLVPDVIAALRSALAIAIRIGDPDHRLRCLRMIGVYELFTGQHDAAIRTLEHFVDVAAVEDASALPEGESHLGVAELLVGRLDSARKRLERLYAHDLQDFNDARFVRFLYARNVDVGNVLSNAQWLTGACAAGLRTAAVNVEHARKSGHALSLSNALAFALPVYFLSGHWQACRIYLALLDEQVMRNGILLWQPLALFYRGALAGRQAASAAGGIDDMARALAALRAIGHLVRMPFYLAVLADTQLRCGRQGEARASIAAALACAHAQNERWCLPEVLRVHAVVLAAAGRPDDSAAVLAEALAVADATGARAWRVRVRADLAALRAARAPGLTLRPLAV